ncbi:peptidylprolyl isomerase [Pseudomonas fontis]|uniref:Peptidylprolyl isomerase n=1 Tax=Pseudomonas fontis TaxID=2942633 RepID=A0ABT5NPW6_9PSED|nr:peptidylprolyl isomerase [Pseudomonas fontis]MDD0974725.1 peptidylprolyl isomerase [Pseudomonas fontis]MDD0990220.1 peptidylprolyl isomerase [Pseudomonas fontis]
MTRRTFWAGAGALAVIAVAVGLAVRPGAQPVAASRPVTLAADSGPALARLGDQQVGVDELKTQLAQLPPPAREQLRANREGLEAWIRSRLAEKALYQQAEAQGWPQRPDVQAQTRAATEQIVLRDYLDSVSQVPEDYPSQDELKRAYEAGKASLQLPARYRLSQIFLAVADEQSLDTVRKQAQALGKRAQAPEADFAALAREFSQDRQADDVGGDSGLQPLAQLLPQVREVVARLKVGAVSEPVQGPAGFHIVRLIEQQPARVATLEEVLPRLRAMLRAQRQEQVAKAYVDGLFNTATLSIDGAALNQVIEANR